MLNFDAGIFATAGLLAAAGPILIHLLNRRRFRVVHWGAMDFLREALLRHRRTLQLRDFLLLALRVLAVILFGLALARPHFVGTGSGTWQLVGLAVVVLLLFGSAIWAVLFGTRQKVVPWAVFAAALGGTLWNSFGLLRDVSTNGRALGNSRQPVHAVLVIDNSRSMGVETLGGTLLDRARTKAREFIDALPAESRLTVIPLCGPDAAFTLDAYRSKDDAKQALERIAVVDLTASATEALELAHQACQQLIEPATKRVVFVTDLQANGWRADSLESLAKRIPDLQIAQVADETPGNVWISDFRLLDGIADVETTTLFLATIRCEAESDVRNVQVRLLVDGTEIASQVIDLTPGQSRQVEFPYQFDLVADPGQANFVTAELRVESDSIAGDRLKSDNYRSLVVPVVTSLPVVFVDQYGEDEDLERNRIGETYRLRHLLAPRADRDESQRQLIREIHTTIEEVDLEMLQSARLVVIAGVERPGDRVSLLREYVEQGGRLCIAAGGEFDPAGWTEDAWLDGVGILPAPLRAEPFGATPEEASGQIEPFFLSFDSMQHDYFLIEQESTDALRDLYQTPLFFKAVQVEIPSSSANPQPDAGDNDPKRKDRRDNGATDESRPRWLLWGSATAFDAAPSGERPRVLASFAGNRLPFLVERNIGRGRVLFLSSGVASGWNTLTQTNAILLFDRIFRSLLEETLPVRNFETGGRITLPIQRREELRYVLQRPTGERETLSVEALGPTRYGLTIPQPSQAGNYLVTAYRPGRDPEESSAVKQEEWPLAVTAPPEESELSSLPVADLERKLGVGNFRLLAPEEPIRVEGGTLRGQDLWKTCILLVLLCLAVEMLVLSGPARKRESAG